MWPQLRSGSGYKDAKNYVVQNPNKRLSVNIPVTGTPRCYSRLLRATLGSAELGSEITGAVIRRQRTPTWADRYANPKQNRSARHNAKLDAADVAEAIKRCWH